MNPAAKEDPSSPIYGMPVFNVDAARSVIVLKRSLKSQALRASKMRCSSAPTP